MKIYTKRDLYLINIASTFAYVGAAATWSGIPYLLVKLTGDAQHFAFMLITSQIIGVVAPFLSKYVVDCYSRKIISILSSIGAIISLLWLINLDFTTSVAMFYIASCCLWLMLYMEEPARKVWQGNIIKEVYERCEEGMARFNAINMIGKAIGFSIGPILFGCLGYYAFFVEVLGYICEVILLFFITYEASLAGIREVKKVTLKFLAQNRHFFWILVSTGIFAYPVLYVGQNLLISKFNASSLLISLFWLMLTLGSIISNLLVSKRVMRNCDQLKIYRILSYVVMIAMIGMLFAPSPYLLIAFGVGCTLINPMLNVIANKDIFIRYPNQVRGQVIALSTSFAAVINIIVLSLLQAFDLTQVNVSLYVLIGMLSIVVFRNHHVRCYSSVRK